MLHVLVIDDNLVESKVIEQLLKISSANVVVDGNLVYSILAWMKRPVLLGGM